MAATITKGTSFTPAQANITAAQFIPLLTSATIVNIDRDNIKSDEATVANYLGVAPSPAYANEVRQGNRHGEFRSYLSSVWTPAHPGVKVYSLDLNSGLVTAGDFLMPSTTVFPSAPNPGTLMKASATTKYAWCAVATENCAPGATSMAIYHGLARCRCSGSVGFGQNVIPSGTDGLVAAAATAGLGYGPQVLGVCVTTDDGLGNVWIHVRK